MNGTNIVCIPKFMECELLPEGYNDTPNPYKLPPVSKYNLRAMVNYALENGRKVYELTKEEAETFLAD